MGKLRSRRHNGPFLRGQPNVMMPCLRRRRRHGAAGHFAAVRRAMVARRDESVLPPQGKDKQKHAFRPLHVLSVGLMGSGKSTLSRALAWILEGVWVNQDEFWHFGSNAKYRFLQEIRIRAASGANIVVDKINILRSHRQEFLEAVGSVDGARVLLRFVHPADPPGKLGRAAVELCLQRISSRGTAHRSLHGDNPKLASILNGARAGFEELSSTELQQFLVTIEVDITLSPEQALRGVVDHLSRIGLLYAPHKDVASALQATAAHEIALRGGQEPLPLFTARL